MMRRQKLSTTHLIHEYEKEKQGEALRRLINEGRERTELANREQILFSEIVEGERCEKFRHNNTRDGIRPFS
jgi:hypothetical protein